jgi:hypothetical protein
MNADLHFSGRAGTANSIFFLGYVMLRSEQSEVKLGARIWLCGMLVT